MSSPYRDPLPDLALHEPPKSRLWIAIRAAARVGVIVFLAFIVLSFIWVIAYRFTEPPTTFIMRRDVAQGMEVDRRPVPLANISNPMVMAVIVAEDQRFCQHKGFDWKAIGKARTHNDQSQRMRGASTISMQTAKNAFLWPTRSWIRKGFEAYFTAMIEVLWPKERIMEVYLNVAEWGDGIYGAEAAAMRYFGVSAAQLDVSQAALLAAALPTPTRSNPAHPTPYLNARANAIAEDMELFAGFLEGCLANH